jgi:hypothetical protein
MPDPYIATAMALYWVGLGLAAAAFVGTGILAWRAFTRAPEGHEDRKGYHTDTPTQPKL